MDHIRVDNEQLTTDGICPSCGWKGKIDYEGDLVTYECKCCGFSTRFAGPDGISITRDYDEEDDNDFMAAAEEAETEAYENCSVDHFVPDANARAGSSVVTVFNNMNSDFADFVDLDIIDDSKHPWRNGKKAAVAYLVVKIFTKYE